jgi:hypothetical protein
MWLNGRVGGHRGRAKCTAKGIQRKRLKLSAHSPLIFVLLKQIIGILYIQKSMKKIMAGCPSVYL